MAYRYYLCDVFTETRFGGNQLAVLPEAEGLSDRQMQQIAREFNFSETTFVFAPQANGIRKVRIFTPAREVPFAGHPNLGTAFALAKAGKLGRTGDAVTVTFEEKAGRVPIAIRKQGQHIHCELTAPERFSLGSPASVASTARALSLAAEDIVTETHPPRVASAGLSFLFVEVRDRAALARASADVTGLKALRDEGIVPDVYLYTRSGDAFDIRARMFAPLDGVPEDPATGSACCALAGLLGHYAQADQERFKWRIAQGVEMGRPSALEARAVKREGMVVETRVGGACVWVGEGEIEVV